MVGLRFRSGTGQRESQKANPPATKKQQKKKKKEKCRTHTQEETRSEEEVPTSSKRHILFRFPKQQMEKFSTLKYNHLGKKFPHVKFHISPLLSSRTVHHKNDQTPNDTYPSWMPTPLDVHGRRHASGQDVLGRQDPALFVVVDHAVNLLHACFVEQMMNEEDKQKNKWG
jgi:hypothetical protein